MDHGVKEVNKSMLLHTGIQMGEEHIENGPLQRELSQEDQQFMKDTNSSLDTFSEINITEIKSSLIGQIRIANTWLAEYKSEYEKACREKNVLAGMQAVKNANELRTNYVGAPIKRKEVVSEHFGFDTSTIPRTADSVELPKEERVGSSKSQKKKLTKLREDEKKREDEKHKQEYVRMKPISIDDTRKPEERDKINPMLIRSKWLQENVLQKTEKKTGKTQEELMIHVLNRDYSNMEQLDPVLRNLLAAAYMSKFDLNGTATEIVNQLTDSGSEINAIMNPLLRLGISLGMQGRLTNGKDPKFYFQLDEAMNTKIMSATITKRPNSTVLKGVYQQSVEKELKEKNDKAEGKNKIKKKDFVQHTEKVLKAKVDTMISNNNKAQLFIAKTMMIAQLGKFKCISKGNKSEEYDWTGTMANAFTHCSRVAITLPTPKETKDENDPTLNKMLGSYLKMSSSNGIADGFFKRGAATHSLHRKRRGGGKSLEELKTLATFTNQQGMNVAIGGLSNDGITGEIKSNVASKRVLVNDGSCGHIYMHLKKGDGKHHTGMLVGFESDSYKKTNQLGHTHGFGNGEFASSFGGQRVDEIGAKYGGRTVDLSEMEAGRFETIMKKFEEWFSNNSKNENQSNRKSFEEKVERLCGTKMSQEEMKSFLKEIGVNN